MRASSDLWTPLRQVKALGYEVEAGGKLVTVFSAPNYCGIMGNQGAVLRFDSTLEWRPLTFAAAGGGGGGLLSSMGFF